MSKISNLKPESPEHLEEYDKTELIEKKLGRIVKIENQKTVTIANGVFQ